jgi:hypothetical protein
MRVAKERKEIKMRSRIITESQTEREGEKFGKRKVGNGTGINTIGEKV